MKKDKTQFSDRFFYPTILVGCMAILFDGQIRSVLLVVGGILGSICWYLTLIGK